MEPNKDSSRQETHGVLRVIKDHGVIKAVFGLKTQENKLVLLIKTTESSSSQPNNSRHTSKSSNISLTKMKAGTHQPLKSKILLPAKF